MSFSWSRLGTWVIALVVGAVYGAACTIAHAYTVGVLPIGLVLAIVGVAALLVAVRSLTVDRWAALAAGLGALGATVVLSGSGPGGSVVVPSGVLGVVWTFAVPVAVAVVVAWPNLSRNGRGSAVAREN